MKTLVIPVLWYASVWFAWEVLWSAGLVPRTPGPVVALIVATAMSLLAWRSWRSSAGEVREYAGTALAGPSTGA